MDKYFPYRINNVPAYRKGQKEGILKMHWALVEQKYDTFIIDGPVGLGKSAMLVTFARIVTSMNKNTYYTTPQKVLQDQLYREFKTIPQLKGRNNYVCRYNPALTCDEGACKSGKLCDKAETCYYVMAKRRFTNNNISCTNVSYILTAQDTVPQRDLYICDEAHSMPEMAVGFAALLLEEKDIGNIPSGGRLLSGYIDWIEGNVSENTRTTLDQLNARAEELQEKLDRTMDIGAPVSLINECKLVRREISRLEKIDKKISALAEDFASGEDDWVVDRQKNSITFTPVTTGRFLGKLLWSKGRKIVLSSGTIVPKFFIGEAGLSGRKFDEKDCVFVAKSTFPSDRSPIYYKPLGKMTRNEKADTFPVVMREINGIIRTRQDRKGIVHTFSYDNARYVSEHIDSSLRHLIRMQDQRARDSSLLAWTEDRRPSVFVSTAMTEGLDLRDERCRYQIYVKVGFPSLANLRVKRRVDRGDWEWYNYQAIEDVEQASGRATRSDQDWSEMFVLDESFGGLVDRYSELVKPWFEKRIVKIGSKDALPSPINFS